MIQNKTQEINSNKRIYQIDLFRFIAALSDVSYHYLFRGYMADNFSALQFTEIGKYFKYGYLGVDLFFNISGFVITLSIKSRGIRDFCISRIVRLYPSYWVSVVVISVIMFLFGSPIFTVNIKQIIANLTMFQNYLNIESVDSVYWFFLLK